jgi:hypothetical protein
LADFETKTRRRLSGRAELSYRQTRQARPLPGPWTEAYLSLTRHFIGCDLVSTTRSSTRSLRIYTRGRSGPFCFDVGRGARPHILLNCPTHASCIFHSYPGFGESIAESFVRLGAQVFFYNNLPASCVERISDTAIKLVDSSYPRAPSPKRGRGILLTMFNHDSYERSRSQVSNLRL